MTDRSPRPTWQAGFTLIELLLVLVILAVLVGVVVVNLNPTERTRMAKVTAAQTDLSEIELALDTFSLDCGRAPNTQEGLQALVQPPPDGKNWKGPYLKKGVPKDPWGNPYMLTAPGQHNTSGVDLWSCGPDGQSDTGDDIDNWSERK
jgi:general secretion pathway protein G